MNKEILTFGVLKLKKIHFTTIRLNKDVDNEKVLLSNKISSGEKNYKFFIGYLWNNNKVKPLHIMLTKANVYVKSYDGQINNGCIFLLKMTY